MPKQKTFEEQAKEAGIKEETLTTLKENEVDTVAVMLTLRPEDCRTLGLKLGQTRLLEAWLLKLTEKPDKAPKAQD